MKTLHSFPRAARIIKVTALGASIALGAASVAQAQTLKFANQGDALSMDPHSLNESFQLAFTANIYEPLVARGKKLELVPALATDWKQTAPTIWRFNLRKGVLFHDGTPFTADDVIFSLNRARADGSGAGVGDEAQRRPGAAGGQLHVHQMGHDQATVG